ncbi:transcriptional regulator [Rhizobium sp. Root1204]|nr:transcriptional regulator [Rhizobium sp. Root1204]
MLTVLETVAEHGPLSAAEVARRCDINRTVGHRLLITLAQRGYLRRDEEGYTLGPAITALSRYMATDLAAISRAEMAKLAAETGETVVLHGLDNNEAVVVDQALGQMHLVRVQHTPGSRHPLHKGASGWSILSFQDTKSQSKILRKVDDLEAANKRIAQTKMDGFAVSHDELQMGVHGIAVPILRADGTCSASLGILVPAGRSELLPALAKPLMAAAAAISKQLPKR